jgi:diguanylate cyclase (GGDEF)-like protein
MHVRGEDIPSRYGGDEFLVVLPDASLEVTRMRAQLLCEDARHFDIQFEGRTLEQIMLSVGVAVFPDHGLTREALLRAADNALYQAKHEGRDQVVVAK